MPDGDQTDGLGQLEVPTQHGNRGQGGSGPRQRELTVGRVVDAADIPPSDQVGHPERLPVVSWQRPGRLVTNHRTRTRKGEGQGDHGGHQDGHEGPLWTAKVNAEPGTDGLPPDIDSRVDADVSGTGHRRGGRGDGRHLVTIIPMPPTLGTEVRAVSRGAGDGAAHAPLRPLVRVV
jgi:hypothetical protein